IVTLTRNGTLQPTKTPGQLFAKFTPDSEKPPAGPAQPQPRYALRKGLGIWKLTFDGTEAELKHERGIFFVAYLLTNPPEQPIHAVDLQAKIPEIYRKHLGLTEIKDPETGKAITLESHARIQERNLGLDDARAMQALWKKEKE